MIIFHPWVPGVRPLDQRKCWEALAELRPHYEVVDVALDPADPYAYARELRRMWSGEEAWLEALLVVEHDVAPSLELVEALEVCPMHLCSRPPGGAPAGAPTAAWLGCTKFTYPARQRVPWAVMPETRWDELDREVTGTCTRATGRYWHLHQEPLEHYHNIAH